MVTKEMDFGIMAMGRIVARALVADANHEPRVGDRRGADPRSAERWHSGGLRVVRLGRSKEARDAAREVIPILSVWPASRVQGILELTLDKRARTVIGLTT